MTEATNLSEWLSVNETAGLLGISPRTLQRMVAQGKGPERRERECAGRRPEPVFNPRDVNGLVAKKNPPRVMPREVAALTALNSGMTHGNLDALRHDGGGGIVPLLSNLLTTAALRPAGSGKYIDLREASELSGLSITCLRRQIKIGALPSILDRCRKVRKSDLDTFAIVSDSGGNGKVTGAGKRGEAR